MKLIKNHLRNRLNESSLSNLMIIVTEFPNKSPIVIWKKLLTCGIEKVGAPPQLSVQKFNEETEDMAAYLDTFEAVATASEWPRTQRSIHLRGSLSGAGLLVISTLNAVQQAASR